MPRGTWWLVAILVFFSTDGSAESIRLVEPRLPTDASPMVSVADVRPAWQKKKEILSLWRTSCDFAITRWGDNDSTPTRAQAVSQGLGKYLDESFRDKHFKLTWFTLHTNRRAPPSEPYDQKEPGLTDYALHSMECRKGAEMIGGVGVDEVSPPAPLVVDIVVEIDGLSFSGRAVRSVVDTNAATVQLVDEALASLARSIAKHEPAPTPCQRLKAAWDGSPKDSFYKKSYKQYCSS